MKKPSTKAYEFKTSGPHVVLFHGYTGSPYDLHPLAEHLFFKNISVQVPLLAGHGHKICDLKNIKALTWLNQSKKILESLDTNNNFFLGGISMGALISILLSINFNQTNLSNKFRNNLRGIILLSPVLELNFTSKILIHGIEFGLINKNHLLQKPSGESDILDPKARKLCPSYSHMPTAGLVEVEHLRQQAIKKLPEISVPIFAAFGQKDAAINIASSHKLILNNTLAPLSIKTYANSKHVITLDYDKKTLNQDIFKFIKKHS